jgi:succinoglycan biosynthesis transport protein ExoP
MLDQPPPFSARETGEAEPVFDLRQILSFVWRHWKFAAAITVLVLVVGITILIRQTPLYTATTQVLLERQREKAPGVEAILATTDPDVAMVEGEIAILKSSVFLRRVVQREHLAEHHTVSDSTASSGDDVPIFSFFRSLVPSLFAEPPQPAPEVGGSDRIRAEEVAATEELKGSLAVSRAVQYGFVLGISVTSPDPAQAAGLSNAIAETYLVDKLDTRFEAAKKASAWLNDRIVELRKQLHESEEAVSQFRTAHGLFQSGNITLNQQQLSELNAKLVEARADAAQKKARLDLLNSLQTKGSGVANMPDLGTGSSLPNLRQQATTLSQQEADLLARYGEAHPLVVNVRAQQHDLERSIAAETQRVAAAIRNDSELAQSRVASLEKSLREATGQSSIDDATAIRLRELERTAAVNKTLFEDFLQRAKVTEEQATFQPTEARIITPALPPVMPSHPRKVMFLSVNLLLGLMLGVGCAVAKEMLNSGFTMTKQVEDILGLPVLASVNRMTDRDLLVDGTAVPIYEYPGLKPLSRFSEAIRALRSGVHMTDVDHPPKIVQFSSAVPREGKTTIALSVCRSAALSKLRVLLIDADMRHPNASRMYNLEKAPGLVDLLLGDVDEEDAVHFQENAGYWILPGGSKTQTPTDLLNSDRMKSLMSGFKEKYDLVVIDTSPVGPVVDAVVVSHLADKVVLVVRWGATARELVKECVQQLSGHKRIAGVALNVVNDRQAQKYGKYAYSYYYRAHHYSGYYAE